ncbi:MAG: PstS family phosphate ABC transporter substrate-binding protein [Acidimicrobiales bacterium]
MSISRRLVALLAILLSFALIAAACGDDDDTDAGTEEGAEEGSEEGAEEGAGEGDLSGEVFVTGSSTVEPVSARTQELFNEINPNVNIAVDGPGTGDGFAIFCDGEADMTGASRAIADDEIAICEENGIEFTELLVGIDGLAVLTSTANDAVECVSFADIYGLVGPESTGFSSWADANELSAELGGAGDLPDAPLDVFGPGEESGTFDAFIEIVWEDTAEERGQEPTTRPDYSPSADDNVIIQGIQGSDTSFGWVGYAFAINSDVKILEVDGGDGCVAPTPETVASGEYPIARPLYFYANNARIAENPAAAAFVDFYVTEGLDTAVAKVGYVELTEELKAETQAAWEGR